jgi:ornithine cyclodeaminase/alanine dehydrogenase-like protein (mu-crystallin family)
MRSTVLTDDAVRRVMPMSAAVDRIASALREHAEGTMVAPPRFRVDVGKRAMIFTAGAVTPPLTMWLAHAEAPSSLPRSPRCQP